MYDLGKIGIDFQIPKLEVLSSFKTQACKNWCHNFRCHQNESAKYFFLTFQVTTV
jgi:hypothetical protein